MFSFRGGGREVGHVAPTQPGEQGSGNFQGSFHTSWRSRSLSGKIQRTRCDSTAGNISVPTTIYNIGPSRHPEPGTSEQLLAETLWQLSGSTDARGGN